MPKHGGLKKNAQSANGKPTTLAAPPKPTLTAPPKLTVKDDQLVLDWPEGAKPAALVIATKNYEAMIHQINLCYRTMTRNEKTVAAARKIVALATGSGVQSATDDDQPVDQPGGGTSMSGTPSD